jgi:hypothetical protein
MRFGLILTVLFLFSCSNAKFNKDIKNKLSCVEIGQVNSIEESECYSYLRQLFHSSSNTEYLLNFTLEHTEDNLAISKSSDVVRKSLTQVVKFELQDKATDKILLKDTISLHSSYSLNTEPLVSYAQMDSNKKFLARRAAEVLRYRLINFFHKKLQRSL